MARKPPIQKRRRNPTAILPTRFPTDAIRTNPHEPCEQCRLSGRRVRFSISLAEAQDVVNALNATTNKALARYFQAHLTIASRRDSYEYD